MSWVEAYPDAWDREYFRREYCPRDGHSNDTSAALARLADETRADVTPITIEALTQRGFSGDLSLVMVAEFPDVESAPDLLRPEG